MPRYFFHLHCGDSVVSDPTGSDLRDPDQAWDAARATALDLLDTEIESDVNLLTCHFSVTDGAGEVVFEFALKDAIAVGGGPN